MPGKTRRHLTGVKSSAEFPPLRHRAAAISADGPSQQRTLRP